MSKYCKTCKFRNESEVCVSGKMTESDPVAYYNNDGVVYPYNEGGDFRVGEYFGCVHHEAKDSLEE